MKKKHFTSSKLLKSSYSQDGVVKAFLSGFGDYYLYISDGCDTVKFYTNDERPNEFKNNLRHIQAAINKLLEEV